MLRGVVTDYRVVLHVMMLFNEIVLFVYDPVFDSIVWGSYSVFSVMTRQIIDAKTLILVFKFCSMIFFFLFYTIYFYFTISQYILHFIL